MDELIAILEDVRPDVDFADATDLLGSGTLTSFDVITLIAALSDEFDIEITPAEMLPANFNSVESIWAMVQRLQDDE